jgi:two-component system CheB/CheR fusion protein
MVVCRNVLIYFTRELQQRTLRLFAFSLRTGGYLVLGKSETVTPFPDSFVAEFGQLKIFRRQGERLLIPPPIGNEKVQTPAAQQADAQRHRRTLTGEISRIQQELQRARSVSDNLLLKLPIGVVVVDARYDIQEINGAARRLLGIYQSAIGEDLIHLATNLPPRVLRSGIDQTIENQEPTILDEVPTEPAQAGEQIFVQISCYPQNYDEQERTMRHVLLLVQDVTHIVYDRQQLQAERDQQRALVAQLEQQINELKQRNTSLETQTAQMQQRIEALEQARAQAEQERQQHEQQLRRVQEINQELARANEDLTNANQQLRITNDEFLMASEEAQATTEEIETLSEETQSTNEELETLNEELQGSIEELTTTTNDLDTRNDALQRQLQERELASAALRVLLEQALPAAACVVAADGSVLLANNAYVEIQQRDGIIEDENGQPLDADGTPQARAARGESFSLSYTVRDGSGSPLRLEAQGYPLSGDEMQGGVIIIRRRDSQP